MTRHRLTVATAALALAVTGTLASGSAAQAAPDTSCQKAGLKELQSAGLLDDVARGGIPIDVAVGLGVAPRPGADLSGVPDPIPLPVLLADHRAGDESLFLYPWC
jgi:hypothetical protein